MADIASVVPNGDVAIDCAGLYACAPAESVDDIPASDAGANPVPLNSLPKSGMNPLAAPPIPPVRAPVKKSPPVSADIPPPTRAPVATFASRVSPIPKSAITYSLTYYPILPLIYCIYNY